MNLSAMSNSRGRYTMRGRQAVFIILGAAVTLTSAAAAGAEPAKQRVAIVSYGDRSSPNGRFVVTPLQAGVLKRDSGRATAATGNKRVVMRVDGQRVRIYDAIVETFRGKLGTLVIRSRIEYVDAGGGYHVGTGTWKVVRGTGQYARIAGGGRRGDVYLDRGPWSGRNEGFLTSR
jgi:hypothetical protein